MVSIIENLKTKLYGKKAAKAAGYKELVLAVADGREPDADEAEAILAAAGKTVEALAKDVALVQDRRRHQADIVAARKAEAEAPAVEAELAAAAAEFEQARQRHEEHVAPIRNRLHHLRKTAEKLHSAEASLRQIAPADLAEATKGNNAASEAAERRRVRPQQLIDAANAQIRDFELHNREYPSIDYKPKIAGQRNIIKTYQAEIDAAEQELAALRQEADRIDREKMTREI